MTSLPEVQTGSWIGGVFHYPIRVFYEDTDLGGMVYHARYISFFERVRSMSISGTLLDVDRFLENPESEGGPMVYVVRNINITYHRQATAGDVLMGHSMVQRVRNAALEVRQWLTRDGEMIAEGTVLLALVDQSGRPRRWPADAKALWQSWYDLAEAAGQI